MTEVTLLGHSALRVARGDQTLLIDPGLFSDTSGLAIADAILIAHGHADHLAPAVATTGSAPIFAPRDVIDQLTRDGADPGRLRGVAPGDQFEAAGFAIEVLGGQHAEIYPGLPPAANNSYLVDGSILDPGDSFAVSPEPATVSTLLLPIAAPWLKLADAIDYAKQFPNAAVLPIHDAVLSDAGQQLSDNILKAILGDRYRRPAQ